MIMASSLLAVADGAPVLRANTVDEDRYISIVIMGSIGIVLVFSLLWEWLKSRRSQGQMQDVLRPGQRSRRHINSRERAREAYFRKYGRNVGIGKSGFEKKWRCTVCSARSECRMDGGQYALVYWQH